MDRKGSAKVSVVIPCHNSAAFLNETVESVLTQTLRNFELVLVDDGSTDSTRTIIERIVSVNPDRQLQFLSQANAGVAAARNAGIQRSAGEFILPLDADDCIEPTTLEECAAQLEADAAVSIVYTDRRDFGDIERVWSAGVFELQRLKYFNQISYCSMFRKSIWREIGGYRTNVTGFDDWDFWIAACLRGFRSKHVPKPLLKHRRHKASFLWKLLNEYTTLFSRIILNNPTAYSEEERAQAERAISSGTPSSMLEASKFIFISRYYQGYRTNG